MKTKIICLILLLTVLSAVAQNASWVYTNLPFATTLTNSVAYSYVATNTISMVHYGEVGFEWRFQGTAAGTANQMITFVRSNDGTNWETTPLLVWTVPLNGTNSVVALTNFLVGPHLWLKPLYSTNAGTVDATNCVLYYGKKGARYDWK